MSSPAVTVAQEFAGREIAPRAVEVARNRMLPADLFRKLGEVGLLGILIPEASGGLGLNAEAVAAITETLAGACGSTAWAYLAHNCAIAAITAFGSEKAKGYLPDLARGSRIATALASTEESGGSNAMGMRTTAKLQGDRYVLNGTKSFVTSAGVADLYVVLARTGEQPGPQALSAFLVPRETPGLSFGRREETLGVQGVSVGELRLEECAVPRDHLLGPEGGGMAVLGATGTCAITGAAAAAVGMARAAADLTKAYLKERQVAGKPLAAVPGVQQSWAQVLVDLETAQALAERGLRRALAGGGPPVVPWLAKVRVTELAQGIIDRCIQLHGANGYSTAYPLERMYRDTRALALHWGNNDVLRSNAALITLGQM